MSFARCAASFTNLFMFSIFTLPIPARTRVIGIDESRVTEARRDAQPSGAFTHEHAKVARRQAFPFGTPLFEW